MQPDPVAIAFTLAILVISVIIHEVAHGYAAKALGDPTAKLAGRLTLNPLRHIDPVGSLLVPALLVVTQSSFLFGWAKPVPYNPHNLRNQRWGEAVVASAGSLTNLFLAIVFGLLARFGAGALPDPVIEIAAIIALVNLFLGIFNLLPIPPLDGFTTLRGLLPYRLAAPLRALEDRVRDGGILTLVIILFAFVYLLARPFSALVGHLFLLLVGGA